MSVALFFLSYHVVSKFQIGSKDPDPREIVIDEVLGTLISLIALPMFFSISYIVLSFILFRVFDYFKPSIIYRIQIKNTDMSIILDDVVAGLITLIIIISLGLNGII
jgi:phosphatidylglycerophosphatase A